MQSEHEGQLHEGKVKCSALNMGGLRICAKTEGGAEVTAKFYLMDLIRLSDQNVG